MRKLHVLVGIPASGKSTHAKLLEIKENAIVVSSDSMRKELYGDENVQDNNSDLFEKMNERINTLLSDGENVIYDATNINRKRRVHLIKNVIEADEYHVYYMNTSVGKCLYNDSNRNRKVGFNVIDKMYKNMNIPTILEGWDTVNFVSDGYVKEKHYKYVFEDCLSDDNHDSLFYDLEKSISEFKEILDMPHDSSYHSFSVSRHTFHVYQYVKENYKGRRMVEMLLASLFHDLGKGYCKSFYNHKGEEKRHASFIGHENVSAQLLSTELTHLGYDDNFVKYVVDLIQFHMIPMSMSEKSEKRLRGLLTDEQYEDLMFLHKADLSAK